MPPSGTLERLDAGDHTGRRMRIRKVIARPSGAALPGSDAVDYGKVVEGTFTRGEPDVDDDVVFRS